MCAYIPDSNNPVYSAQQVVGGMFGIDADQQAWLTKYATRPSHDSMHSALGVQTVDQISTILRDQFDILPKSTTRNLTFYDIFICDDVK
jgi:hypothetical protein